MALRFNTIMRALLAGNSTPSVPSFYFNFSNPSNVTLGAAQARGTITSTQNAHITMSASLSRVVGVAPLYVNIDMTGTTSDLTANATHDLFYSVNWGDPDAGQWANGVQSPGLTDKNWSFGPVSGHVFETPGTYLVTPTSTDGVNSAAKPGYVTVLDPNVVYDPAYGAGYETICISNSNNFTGAPGTGALPGVATYINRSGDTDMYAAWNTYKASNKRILFCKADAWTCTASLTFNTLSGVTVGGYGTGIAATFGTGTVVSVTPSAGISSVFQAGGSIDCRICNFSATANPTLNVFTATSADTTQLLWCKNECRGAYAGFSVTPSTGLNSLFPHDQHCIFECLVDELYGYAGTNPPSFTGAAGAIGTPGVFTAAAHQFRFGNKVRLTGTPPAPLATATDYYISATNLTANTFSLSAAMFPDTPLALSGIGTCDVTAISLSGGIGAFPTLTRGGVMGCYFDACNYGEQTLRIPYMSIAHINNNYIARPNQTKNIFKIHSRGYTNIVGVSSGYSEKFVVTANVMDLRGGYSYNAAIPNNGNIATFVGTPSIIMGNGGVSEGSERVRNAIIQNNLTHASLGSPKDALIFAEVNCPNVTVRNNIADFAVGVDRSTAFTGDYAYTYLNFVSTTTSTADGTVGVRIYNNTLYSNLANAEKAQFVNITAPAGGNPVVDDVTIKNNIWYTPFHPNAEKTAYYNPGLGTNIVASNNTDNGQTSTTSPNFVATPPVAITDWRPNTGSYAIKTTGTPVLLRDFNNAPRVGGFDHLGAVLP